MLDSIMLLGIGFLAACLLMAMLTPLIHERAVRLTVRRLLGKRPRTVIERRVHEDHLRAEFAMSVRRLETTIEDTQAKAAAHQCEISRKSAEINRLKTELRKTSIVILRFQARELMRRSMIRAIVKVLVYLFARSNRQSGRELPTPAFKARDIRKSTLSAASV